MRCVYMKYIFYIRRKVLPVHYNKSKLDLTKSQFVFGKNGGTSFRLICAIPNFSLFS